MTSSSKSSEPRRRWRVLLAEDDEDMRVLVEETLTRDGYEVHAVEDGTQLRLAATVLPGGGEPFDLIISDVRLPGPSGLAFLQWLRATGRKTPVLLMTAFGDERSRALAASLGSQLMSKPFEILELREEVRRLLPS